MGESVEEQPGGAPTGVASAMSAARELLAAAEVDAAGIRAEADHYARQREQEAELLVAKARRILSVAEEKAAGLLVTARSHGHGLDLDEPVVSVPIDEVTDDQLRRIVAPRAASPMGFDGRLASAIASAVDRTFSSNSRPAR